MPSQSDPSDAIAVVGDSANIAKAIQMVIDKVRPFLPPRAAHELRLLLMSQPAPPLRRCRASVIVQSKSVAFEEFPIGNERLQRYVNARGKAKLRELEKDRKSTVAFTGTAIEVQGPPEEAAAMHADVAKLVKSFVRAKAARWMGGWGGAFEDGAELLKIGRCIRR